jgi:hypothetical protein
MISSRWRLPGFGRKTLDEPAKDASQARAQRPRPAARGGENVFSAAAVKSLSTPQPSAPAAQATLGTEERTGRMARRWAELTSRMQGDPGDRVDELRANILRNRMEPSGTITGRSPGWGRIAGADAHRAAAHWIKADDLVQQWISERAEVTPGRIQQLNGVIHTGIPSASPLRTEDLNLDWIERSRFAAGHEVAQRMEAFGSWYAEQKASGAPPVRLAAEAQLWLLMIHPFRDGNGRTARLITDWILQAAGLPPVNYAEASWQVRLPEMEQLFSSSAAADMVSATDIGMQETLAFCECSLG